MLLGTVPHKAARHTVTAPRQRHLGEMQEESPVHEPSPTPSRPLRSRRGFAALDLGDRLSRAETPGRHGVSFQAPPTVADTPWMTAPRGLNYRVPMTDLVCEALCTRTRAASAG